MRKKYSTYIKLRKFFNHFRIKTGKMSLRKKNDRNANSRQQKTRSLIVPTTIVSDSSEYGSPSPESKHRFSFRNFRRGRSLSKSRCSSSPNELEPGGESPDGNCDYEASGVRSDDSDRGDIDTPTPATSPMASPIRKSLSVVDFRSFYTKLQRHLTTGLFVFICRTRMNNLKSWISANILNKINRSALHI